MFAIVFILALMGAALDLLVQITQQ
jgi:hypothetical protein